MIKIFSKLTHDNGAGNKENISFTSRRDDHNTVAILKNDTKALNVPVQKRIIESINKLSKDGSSQNIQFLLDVAENVQYGLKSDSELANTTKSEFKYNYLNLQKDSWSNLLKASIGEALTYNTSEDKELLQAQFDEVFPKDETERVSSEVLASQHSISNSIKDEKAIAELKNNILTNKLLNIKNPAKKPENYDKYVQDIHNNIDKFILSPETSLTEKKEILIELSRLLSPEYKINPMLKDRKPQVVAEILNDISGQTKQVNQKHHGSCAAISISRKFMAAEHKLEFVKSIMNELDNKPEMEVFNIYDYSKKVKVQKANIDYNTALQRTYRIVDASVLNWMNIADTYSDGSKASGYFNPFDAENYDMFHDAHMLNNMKGNDATKQLYLRSLNKLNELTKKITKLKHEKTNNVSDYESYAKSNEAVSAHTRAKVRTVLSNLGISGDDNIKIADLVLSPNKVVSPDLKIVKYDEDPLKRTKIKNIILSEKPELAESANLNSAIDEMLKMFNMKEESNLQLSDLRKKVKMSDSDSDMENEFKSGNYNKSLFELEAFNRVARDFELDNPERVVYYRNKYNLPSIDTVIKGKLSEALSNLDSIPEEQVTKEITDEKKILNGLNQYISEIVPAQVESILQVMGLPGLDGLKILADDYLNNLKIEIFYNKDIEQNFAAILNDKDKMHMLSMLDDMIKDVKKQTTEEGVIKTLKPIGMHAKHDLTLAYIMAVQSKLRNDKEYPNTLANVMTQTVGQEISPADAKDIIDEFREGLSDQEKQISSMADFLQIPFERDVIFKKMEQKGLVQSKKVLDELFDMYNKKYINGETKTKTDYNIFINNKAIAESFEKHSQVLDAYIAKLPVGSYKSDDLNALNDKLKKAILQLQGVNISKASKTLLQITKDIAVLKEKGSFDNTEIASVMDSISAELQDKVTVPYKLDENKYSDFYKKAEERYSMIRKNGIRDKELIYSEMKPKIEQAYNTYGENEGMFWVWAEGSSGLARRHQSRILSQMTGVDYHSFANPVNAANAVKNSRHSGVNAVSVSHSEPAMHAMYVYDVIKNETTTPEGDVKVDTVVCHDNSWGPKELNGLRLDSNGLMRTDYTRRFGENGGYYVNDQFINGVSLDDLKYGQFTVDTDKNHYVIQEKDPIFSEMLIEGKDHKAHDKAISLYQNIDELLHSEKSSYVSDIIDLGLLPANPSMKSLVEEGLSVEFNTALDNVVNGAQVDNLAKYLNSVNAKFINASIDIYKSNSRKRIVKASEKFVNELVPTIDLNSPASVVGAKKKYEAFLTKLIDKNYELKETFNFKKYNEIEKLTDLKEKELLKFIGVEGSDSKINSREDFEKLSPDHPLKIIMNNMAFQNTRVSKLAYSYLQTFYNDKNALVKAKELNLADRKTQFLDLLNLTPASVKTPFKFKSIDDLKEAKDGTLLIGWLDKKFSPADDAELMAVYNKLSTLESYDSVKKMLDESSEEDLGIKYADPYVLLRNIQVGHEDRETFSKKVTDYVIANSILTAKDIEAQKKLYAEHIQWADSPEGKKFKLFQKEYVLTHAVNNQYLTNDETLYRSLYIDSSYLNFNKRFKKYIDMNYQKYGVYSAFPDLHVQKDKNLKQDVSMQMISLIGLIRAIEKEKQDNDGIMTKQALSFKKYLDTSMKKFVQTTVQPRYQAKAASMLKDTFNNVINSNKGDEVMKMSECINFFVEKNITKDIGGLFEHINKNLPKMDLQKFPENNEILDSWMETLNAGFRVAQIAEIEFKLREVDNIQDASYINLVKNEYEKLVSTSLFKNYTFDDYITTVVPVALMDPANDNHTLKMFYSKLGLFDKALNNVMDREKYEASIEKIKSDFEKLKTLPIGEERKNLLIGLSAEITRVNAKGQLMGVLSTEVTKNDPRSKELKAFIKYFNANAKPILAIDEAVNKILMAEITAQ